MFCQLLFQGFKLETSPTLRQLFNLGLITPVAVHFNSMPPPHIALHFICCYCSHSAPLRYVVGYLPIGLMALTSCWSIPLWRLRVWALIITHRLWLRLALWRQSQSVNLPTDRYSFAMHIFVEFCMYKQQTKGPGQGKCNKSIRLMVCTAPHGSTINIQSQQIAFFSRHVSLWEKIKKSCPF